MSEAGFVITAAIIALDVFTTSWYTAALHEKTAIKKQPFTSLIMAAGRALLLLTGVLSGMLMHSYLGPYSIASTMSLLVIIGIKTALDAWNFNLDEKVILADNLSTVLLLSLAGGVGAFLTGLAIGTAGGKPVYPVLSVFVVSLLIASAGMYAGKRHGFKGAIRYSGMVPGLFFICFGIIHLVLTIV